MTTFSIAARSKVGSLFLVVAFFAACGGRVEVVPASSGSGGSGQGGHGGGASTSASGGTDASSGDGAPCGGCWESFNSGASLCSKSQPIFDALVACICQVACPVPCAATCQQGEDADQACIECVNASDSPGGACVDAFTACMND